MPLSLWATASAEHDQHRQELAPVEIADSRLTSDARLDILRGLSHSKVHIHLSIPPHPAFLSQPSDDHL
ncbi:hypothetical protein PGTUg99_037516 [Puccinia graminis f. sp. tritici]|uniref:Uncharacterized protein n=1 Tax=Puccinia graminis f. sp. tritici TaxID=56615 RepID=A0A5B0R9T9_PUCGR|nr:hypothetical protein PGTUg99_037516 [Puccinia graminis f. sp. tritici]